MIGNLQIKNRFVHSATYEGMADTHGKVTDDLIRRYHTLAKMEHVISNQDADLISMIRPLFGSHISLKSVGKLKGQSDVCVV